ncbi:MAG: AraC family transcriptional regulator [Saprospiraceae bacterium]|nr:AraC family transcriptional regulator [Saprospiraceae bacterium]
MKISNLIHFLPIIILASGILMGLDVCPKIGALLYVSLLVYTFFSIRAILSYRKVVKNTRSSSHLIDLKWLQWTMIVFSIILFADIIDHNFFDITTAYGVSFVHLVLLFLVNGMFYKGLKQPQIFMGITQSDQLITITPKNDDNVNKIEEDVKEELDQIRHYMQLHKPFTDSNLSLHELAKQLQMPPRRLSYLINKYLDQSFMAFINSYRIELAQERLSNPKDDTETVIEVMYEVGFNSKSSFNTLFKQKTGFTPTEFKRRQA